MEYVQVLKTRHTFVTCVGLYHNIDNTVLCLLSPLDSELLKERGQVLHIVIIQHLTQRQHRNIYLYSWKLHLGFNAPFWNKSSGLCSFVTGHRKKEGHGVFLDVCNYWFQFAPFSSPQASWNEELRFCLLPTEPMPITLGNQYIFIGKLTWLKSTASWLFRQRKRSHAQQCHSPSSKRRWC